RRPAGRAATSTTSACASTRLTKPPSSPILLRTGLRRTDRRRPTSARKATALRSTSTTPTATPSNSRALLLEPARPQVPRCAGRPAPLRQGGGRLLRQPADAVHADPQAGGGTGRH